MNRNYLSTTSFLTAVPIPKISDLTSRHCISNFSQIGSRPHLSGSRTMSSFYMMKSQVVYNRISSNSEPRKLHEKHTKATTASRVMSRACLLQSHERRRRHSPPLDRFVSGDPEGGRHRACLKILVLYGKQWTPTLYQ